LEGRTGEAVARGTISKVSSLRIFRNEATAAAFAGERVGTKGEELEDEELAPEAG
jgi:hypothetical protein